jgi:hypothetical protein
MNREPRRIAPRILATQQQRRATREVAALPKGSKTLLNKKTTRNIGLSPSLPHTQNRLVGS